MLNLLELEQLAAFADWGTLSKVAEQLHISQPTITRTMQHLEEEFGVPLFSRSKNKIQLNETGKKAVEYAKSLLEDAREAVAQVQAFHKRLHTITVQSCAPAPCGPCSPSCPRNFPNKPFLPLCWRSRRLSARSVTGIVKWESCPGRWNRRG